MIVGRLFGVRIRLNSYFLILLVILSAGGLLGQALALFTIVLLHELAHVWVARLLGVRVAEVELLPFGGVARLEDFVELDPGVEAQVALAGPLTNLFLLGIGLLLGRQGIIDPAAASFYNTTNVVLAAFNMLPALPLDGGRIFRAWLVRRMGYRKGTERAVAVSRASALLLAVGGLWGAWAGYLNLSLVLIAFFIYAAAGREDQSAPYLLLRYLIHKDRELEQEGCLGAETLIAKRRTPLSGVVRLFVPKRYHVVHIVDETGRLLGTATERELTEAFFRQGPATPVEEVLRMAR